MEIAITKMSKNGQVVIPAEVRQDAGLKPAVKFLVFNEGKDLLLKQLDKKELLGELELIRKIERSEEQIARGESVTVDPGADFEEIDKALKE